MGKTNWTDQEIQRLKSLWSQGKSVTKIAITLGRSRSMISGKISRLGLKKRITMKEIPNQKYEPPASAKEISMTAYGNKKPLIELGGKECAWPVGDPKAHDFGFCAAPVSRGGYCEQHASIAYRKVREKNYDE